MSNKVFIRKNTDFVSYNFQTVEVLQSQKTEMDNSQQLVKHFTDQLQPSHATQDMKW